jgi:hypothetical protein
MFPVSLPTRKKHAAHTECLCGSQSRSVLRAEEKIFLSGLVIGKRFPCRPARSLVPRKVETSEVQRCWNWVYFRINYADFTQMGRLGRGGINHSKWAYFSKSCQWKKKQRRRTFSKIIIMFVVPLNEAYVPLRLFRWNEETSTGITRKLYLFCPSTSVNAKWLTVWIHQSECRGAVTNWPCHTVHCALTHAPAVTMRSLVFSPSDTLSTNITLCYFTMQPWTRCFRLKRA